MINSRSLADLDPLVREICNRHLAACTAAGIELLVTSTYRDFESQTALYAIGRTIEVKRRKVTHAKAGESWHNFRAAYDVVPLINGKPVWNASDPLWNEVVVLGKAAGAEAGADWPLAKRDLPHFQCRPTINGLHITTDEALARFKAHGTVFVD